MLSALTLGSGQTKHGECGVLQTAVENRSWPVSGCREFKKTKGNGKMILIQAVAILPFNRASEKLLKI